MPLSPELEAALRLRLEDPHLSPAAKNEISRVLTASGRALDDALTLQHQGGLLSVSDQALCKYFACNFDMSRLSEIERAFVDLAFERATPQQQKLAAEVWANQSNEQRLRADEREVATNADLLRGAAQLAGRNADLETRLRVARGLLQARWPSDMVRDQHGSLVPSEHGGEPAVGEDELLRLSGFSSTQEFWHAWLHWPLPRGEFVLICRALAPDWPAHSFWRALEPALANDTAREVWAARTGRPTDRTPEQVRNMPRERRAIYERPVLLEPADIQQILSTPDLRRYLPRSLFRYFEIEPPEPVRQAPIENPTPPARATRPPRQRDWLIDRLLFDMAKRKWPGNRDPDGWITKYLADAASDEAASSKASSKRPAAATYNRAVREAKEVLAILSDQMTPTGDASPRTARPGIDPKTHERAVAYIERHPDIITELSNLITKHQS